MSLNFLNELAAALEFDIADTHHITYESVNIQLYKKQSSINPSINTFGVISIDHMKEIIDCRNVYNEKFSRNRANYFYPNKLSPANQKLHDYCRTATNALLFFAITDSVITSKEGAKKFKELLHENFPNKSLSVPVTILEASDSKFSHVRGRCSAIKWNKDLNRAQVSIKFSGFPTQTFFLNEVLFPVEPECENLNCKYNSLKDPCEVDGHNITKKKIDLKTLAGVSKLAKDFSNKFTDSVGLPLQIGDYVIASSKRLESFAIVYKIIGATDTRKNLRLKALKVTEASKNIHVRNIEELYPVNNKWNDGKKIALNMFKVEENTKLGKTLLLAEMTGEIDDGL